MIRLQIKHSLGRAAAVLLLWGAMAACDKAKVAEKPDVEPPAPASGITLVLPFVDLASIYGVNADVHSPASSKFFVTGQVDESSAVFMNNELYRLIGGQSRFKWGSAKNLQASLALDKSGLEGDHLAQLQTLGVRQEADSVMIGYIYVFRDRSGGEYGAEIPARVVFELVLIRTDSGRVIWQRAFKETQKSLSEDLFQLGTFIKRRGRWISAREMAAGALEEMIGTFPKPPGE